jgi:hypothetical protein
MREREIERERKRERVCVQKTAEEEFQTWHGRRLPSQVRRPKVSLLVAMIGVMIWNRTQFG